MTTMQPTNSIQTTWRTITREELYEQVWARPVRRLAGEYGLSDVGFAKI